MSLSLHQWPIIIQSSITVDILGNDIRRYVRHLKCILSIHTVLNAAYVYGLQGGDDKKIRLFLSSALAKGLRE
jgi:hypothetical protein